MIKKILKYSIIAAIWLLLWQFLAMAVGQELLFPTPLSVAKRIFELAATLEFYKIIAHSLLRIIFGMIFGTLIGIIGGFLSARFHIVHDFFAPILVVIKATPVASFIILLVLYFSRDLTPLIIALTVVTPIVWTGVEAGILSTDKSLLEMAQVYKMTTLSKIKHIFLPSILPYLSAALKSSLGMAWKAGIAAEVLLQPLISIGKMIFDSKILLETTDLFAWTAVVIALSVAIEKIFVFALEKAMKNRSLDEKGGARFG